jgi:LysM repeat protein
MMQLGKGPAVVVDGYGGVVLRPRPKRRATTGWEGRNPIAVRIPFLIDYSDEGDTAACEEKIWTLEQMAGLGDADDGPPELVVNASGAVPHDYYHRKYHRWKIESNIEWDEDLIWKDENSGLHLRTGGAFVVRQVVKEQRLDPTKTAAEEVRDKGKRKKRKEGKKSSPSNRYTVKVGDTLQSIAKDKLDNADRWDEIADLNDIDDPRSLQVGKVLKLP